VREARNQLKSKCPSSGFGLGKLGKFMTDVTEVFMKA
jgi:hypothetical protein